MATREERKKWGFQKRWKVMAEYKKRKKTWQDIRADDAEQAIRIVQRVIIDLEPTPLIFDSDDEEWPWGTRWDAQEKE